MGRFLAVFRNYRFVRYAVVWYVEDHRHKRGGCSKKEIVHKAAGEPKNRGVPSGVREDFDEPERSFVRTVPASCN